MNDKNKTSSAVEPRALIAFHGSDQIKDKYLTRVRAHKAADEIINGRYWERGKGCAVGCTVHSSDHAAYEEELGVPRVLARLEDRLFEALYVTDPVVAKEWPLRFLEAISPGADLSLVWAKFALWLLGDPAAGVIRFAKKEKTKAAIQGVTALYQRWADGDKPATTEWESARRNAYAAYAYAYAAYDAAYAADAAYAYAAYAADAAYAYAAYAAAYAYAYDAYDAAYAADAAYAYDAADARRKHYLLMADKLIELLKEARVP